MPYTLTRLTSNTICVDSLLIDDPVEVQTLTHAMLQAHADGFIEITPPPGSAEIGPPGPPGTPGQGFTIAKVYSSVAALTADVAPTGINSGEFAIIDTGDVENPENSRIYVWNGSTYSYVNDLSGEMGIQGFQGLPGTAGDPKVLATQAEAEAGTDNSAYMSPLRNMQALKAQLIAGGNITLTPQAGGVEITASASGSTTFIYAPSKTQAGNVFNNWGDLTTHIAAMPDGEIPTVIFTESCTLPVGTYNMKLGKWASSTMSTGAITVTLPDGMLIQNLCYIQDGLQVNVEPTTADGVFVNTLFGGFNILVIGLGAKLVNLGTKAAIVTDGFLVVAQFFATIAVTPYSTAPWVKCLDGHTVQAMILGNLVFSQFEEDWVVGGGTTGNLLYFHGDSFAVPPLTQWTGNPPTYINSAKAEMVQYFDSFEPSVTTGATQVQQAIDWLKVNSLRDAPSDTKLYGRKDGAWAEVTGGGGGIADAPSNGMMYGRKDAAWGHALSPSTALVDLMGLLPFVSGDSVLWSAINPELPLSGVPTPGDVADVFGYQPTLIDGDLVWVLGRSTASENGVYSVDTAGAWTRVFNPAEHQDTLYLVYYPRLMYQDGTLPPVQSTAIYTSKPLSVRFDADGNVAAIFPFPGVTGQASYVPFTVSKKEGGDAVWNMLHLGQEQSTLYPVAYTPRAQFDLATVLSGHILTIVPQAYADANINLADGYNPAVKDWATGAAYTYLQDNEEIVLVANQTDSSENGYYKPSIGTWSPVILFTTLKYCSKVTAEYNNIVPVYVDAKAGPAEANIAFDGSLTSVRFVGGNVLEAPIDTKTYGRKDGGWAEVTGGGGSGPIMGLNGSRPDMWDAPIYGGSNVDTVLNGVQTVYLRNTMTPVSTTDGEIVLMFGQTDKATRGIYRTSSTGDWNQIYSRDELAAATGWLVPAPYILNDSYTNQGLTISFDQDCALHFNDSPLVAMPAYATAEYPGWVKPDGVTTTVDNDGTIHAVAANPEAYKMKGYTIYWEASTNVPLTGMIHTDVDIPPYEGMLGYVHGQTNSSENGFYQMYSGSWTCVASSADLYAACAIQVTRNYPNQEVTSEILKFNIDNTDSVVCLYADPQYDITVNKGGVTPVTIGSGRIGSGNVMIGSGVLPEMTRGNRIIAIGQNVATDFVDSGGGSVYIGCSIVGRSDDADCLYLGNSAGADVAPDGGNNGCAYIAAGNKTILMYVDSQKFWRTREDISVLAHGAGRNIKSIYDIDSCTLWGERVVESTEAGYYLTAYGARSQLNVTMTHRVYTSVVDNGLGKARFLTTDTNDIEVGDLCLGDSINIHEVTPYGTTMTVTSVNPGVSIDFDFDYSADFASSFLNLFDSMGNTSVGADTLNNVTRGCFNTVFGINAGYSLSNGARGNTLIGPYAGSTLPSDGRNYINLRNWKGEGLIFNSDTRKWTHDGSLITTDGFNSTFLVYDENADKYVTAKHIKAPNGFDSSLIAYDTNTNEWLLEGSIKTTDGFDSSLYNKVDAGISIVSNTWTIPDLSKSNKYSLTLSNSGNSILIDNPTTGVISGQSGVIYLTQDNTTACNITFGSNWKSMSGITGAASQTLGAKNLIRFEVQDANVIWYDYSTGGVA